jgi:DNA mismatch repair protein MutS
VIRIDSRTSIDEGDLKESFIRASGPGGQNVNNVSTAVELRYDARGAATLPEDVRERLMRLAGARLTQEGVIVILAQMGAFVPAKGACIGVVDRLFSRVGAADDLARGRSTFMVEMVETAAILNQATERSLVILDEIGRGTATFDGLSIAWASIEHLHQSNRSRALFATHFHELTQLTKKLPRLMNLTMRVSDWKGEVVFLHEVAAGAADRSYGIQVARLAGLPQTVVARAGVILAELEASDRQAPVQRMIDDLPLFAAAAPRAPVPAPAPDPLLGALDAIEPDELSPREALEHLYALKRLRAKP